MGKGVGPYCASVMASLVAQMVMNLLACNVGNPGLIPGLEIPWRRKWRPISVFLPGKFHGQRSMVGYSPRGCRELDMNEQLTLALA